MTHRLCVFERDENVWDEATLAWEWCCCTFALEKIMYPGIYFEQLRSFRHEVGFSEYTIHE